MRQKIGMKIRFTIYDSKGFPAKEVSGVVVDVSWPNYIAKAGGKKHLVCKDDYISMSKKQ